MGEVSKIQEWTNVDPNFPNWEFVISETLDWQLEGLPAEVLERITKPMADERCGEDKVAFAHSQ